MPWYNDLRPESDSKKKSYSLVFPEFSNDAKIRTIDNLLRLRDYIGKNIQVRKNMSRAKVSQGTNPQNNNNFAHFCTYLTTN